MARTVQAWIDDCRYRLDGDKSEEANLLASPYTAASDSTLTFSKDLKSIGEGAILCIGPNTFRVTGVNALTKTATVIPAYMSSIDASAATGSLVRVNPRFTDFRLLTALNDHLSTLTAPAVGLFAVAAPQTLTVANGVLGYEITPATGFLRILEVRRQLTDDTTSYVRVPTADWELLRSADTASFPSGVAIRFLGTAQYMTAAQVVWAKQFTTTTTVTDLVSTTGIPSTAEDIPPIGAAIDLMAAREIPRNNPSSQGDTRRANEVGPGAIAASYRGLQQRWLQRTKEEADRLRSLYPTGK